MVIRVSLLDVIDGGGKSVITLLEMESHQKAPVFVAVMGDDGRYRFARPQSAEGVVTMDDVFAKLAAAPDQASAAAFLRTFWPDIDNGLLSAILGALAAQMAGGVIG